MEQKVHGQEEAIAQLYRFTGDHKRKFHVVGKELNTTFQKYPPWAWWVKLEQIHTYFSKVLTMDLLGIGQANCFRTHNELTMGLLGKCPLAPSVDSEPWRVGG